MSDRKGYRPPCGAHVELAKEGATRVTRCACGTIHLHVGRVGVSLQLNVETLVELAKAVARAAGEVEPAPSSRSETPPDRCTN